MVFSSVTFLFYFLPVVLLFYFFVSKKNKNYVLLIASLFFYFYGEQKYIIILLLSALTNYYFGKKIETSNKRKIYLILDLCISFGMLFYFKYLNFTIDNINKVFSTTISYISVILPIGISFFTFQATSYVIDIYKGKVKSAENFLDFLTYLSLFPQLIAGPIVRYETISNELKNRKVDSNTFARGIKRFIIGLSKKVLLANVLGEFIIICNNLEVPSILSNWFCALAITFQLYFDFSGYSDMAIGLGLLFGFHFLENFNYPLISKSITEFWRRWHISLSSWLKDYIYIPLGGSRCSKLKHFRNIFIVWLTTGLWHGASFNFILWGFYFAVLLILEKYIFFPFLKKHNIISHIYTFILIIISFVIFHFENLNEGLLFLKNMFFLGDIPFSTSETIYYIKSYFIIFVIAIIASTPIIKILTKKLYNYKKLSLIFDILEVISYIILFIVSVSFIVSESFNPFLYFRF